MYKSEIQGRIRTGDVNLGVLDVNNIPSHKNNWKDQVWILCRKGADPTIEAWDSQAFGIQGDETRNSKRDLEWAAGKIGGK